MSKSKDSVSLYQIYKLFFKYRIMIDAIFNHRSIRKYKSDPVPQEILDKILEAAVRASNTGSMQAYSIIVNRDPEMLEKLSPLHFNQPMTKQAPLQLSFCTDLNRFSKWCENRKAEPSYHNFLWFYTGSIDAVIAAQNAALEAEAHGLGICYLGTTNYNADKMIELMELPKGVVPVTTLVVGYPDESPELTDRLPIDAVVHYEKYKDYDKKRIDELYTDFENTEFNKNLLEENQTETLAQVFTQKRYIKENNENFSKALLEVVKKQGFMDDKE